jgi:hypothetical protein
VDDERGGWSGRLGAPPVGQCGSHTFSLLDSAARGHPCRVREWVGTRTRSNDLAETGIGNRSISNRLYGFRG